MFPPLKATKYGLNWAFGSTAVVATRVDRQHTRRRDAGKSKLALGVPSCTRTFHLKSPRALDPEVQGPGVKGPRRDA